MSLLSHAGDTAWDGRLEREKSDEMMEKKFGREEKGKKTRIKYMAGSGAWEGNSFCLSHKLKRSASTGTHDFTRLPSDKGNLSGRLDKRRGGGVLGGRNEKQRGHWPRTSQDLRFPGVP